MMAYVMNRRCDMGGNTVLRVFRHQLLARVIPLGNYRGGAGFKCLVIFTVLHYFGRPLFSLLIRFERQLSALYRIRERLLNKEHAAEDSGVQGG